MQDVALKRFGQHCNKNGGTKSHSWNVFTTAKLCRTCRNRESDRRAEARRIHLEGIALKT